jgi:hypothetical protein
MAIKIKRAGTPSSPAPRLFAELRRAVRSVSIGRPAGTVHHSNANPDPQWDEKREETHALPFAKQTFQIQLQLEQHVRNGEQRVTMFGRRIDPPSTTLSKNTQRATFNSHNVGENGFFVRPQLLKKRPELPRALAAELPPGGALPFWSDRKIHLGNGSARSVVTNFLKAVATLEETKGMEVAELVRLYPPVQTFTVEDLKRVELFNEGKMRNSTRTTRDRSRQLREFIANSYRKNSRDGRLHCVIDGWCPPVPVIGDIVQIHHDQTIEDCPKEGRTISQEDALQYLFPLCPNCHGVLHSKPGGGRYTIAELRNLGRKPRH